MLTLISGSFSFTRALAPLGVIACLSACGSAAPTTQTAAQAHADSRSQPTSPASTRPKSAEAETCVPNALVYFGFDSAELDSASRDKLAAAAACMRQGSDKRMTITGMTDPRGTEEYNLALGERRAQVTAGYITAIGVESGRVAKRSYGEEYARGRDESGWANDRRAEIKVE